MAVKYECRGYMCAPPKRGKGRGGWAPFTVKWGPVANRATKGK
jgi:hypothetical protein